jgi:hypothetical protein
MLYCMDEFKHLLLIMFIYLIYFVCINATMNILATMYGCLSKFDNQKWICYIVKNIHI